MKQVLNKQVAKAPGLVRLAMSPGGWAAADNDMNAVFVKAPGWREFRPAVQALFIKPKQQRVPLIGAVYAAPAASRCYMPSLIDLPDGGAILECKLGVKEVEDSGTPFDKCEWGMYLVRYDAAGAVKWHNRFQIHKGNAMVVAGGDPSQVRLIATGGACWVISAETGAILMKTSVPMGESGEKVFATAAGCSCVGYTGHASTVARYGIDEKAIPVQTKPPYDIGADEWRCANCTPAGRPRAIWWAMVLKGQLLYNFVGPQMKGRAKFPVTKLPSGGPADAEIRHPVALFPIAGSRHVGAAVKDEKKIQVQVLDMPQTRIVLGPGAWAAAVVRADGTIVVGYLDGGYMYEAVVDPGTLPE